VASPVSACENIEKEELLKIVHDALRESSTLTKDAFWMRVENIPAKEVASKLNTTPQTVHNIFSKSLDTVRKYVKKYYLLSPGIVVNKRE